MLATQDLITKLRKNELELYSAETQEKIEKSLTESEAKAVLEQRQELSKLLNQLDKQNLEKVLTEMKLLGEELKKATEDLDADLKDINNTVKFLGNIRRVTGLITRVLTFL